MLLEMRASSRMASSVTQNVYSVSRGPFSHILSQILQINVAVII